MSLRVLDQEGGQLLANGGKFGHFLTSGSKLGGQFLTWPLPHGSPLLLHREAIPNTLLIAKECRLLLAAVHENLRKGYELKGKKRKDEGQKC